MSERKPKAWELTALRLWHAWVMGGFVVAYLTADEDTYSIHLFTGCAVLAAVALRLIVGLTTAKGPWALPRPDAAALMKRLAGQSKGRHPLFAWFAAALTAALALSAASGGLAHFLPFVEDPHEALSELVLWIIGAHVAFVFLMYGGKRRLGELFQKLNARREMVR